VLVGPWRFNRFEQRSPGNTSSTSNSVIKSPAVSNSIPKGQFQVVSWLRLQDYNRHATMCRAVELQLSAGPEPQHSTDGEDRQVAALKDSETRRGRDKQTSLRSDGQ
jgi:hypothetical protein